MLCGFDRCLWSIGHFKPTDHMNPNLVHNLSCGAEDFFAFYDVEGTVHKISGSPHTTLLYPYHRFLHKPCIHRHLDFFPANLAPGCCLAVYFPRSLWSANFLTGPDSPVYFVNPLDFLDLSLSGVVFVEIWVGF